MTQDCLSVESDPRLFGSRPLSIPTSETPFKCCFTGRLIVTQNCYWLIATQDCLPVESDPRLFGSRPLSIPTSETQFKCCFTGRLMVTKARLFAG